MTMRSTSLSSRSDPVAATGSGSPRPMGRRRSTCSRFLTFCVAVVGNTEPVREGDHVFLPTVQPEEPVRIELPEVAGVKPALLVDRGAGGLLVLPVALEDVRSAGDDLALLGDLHLDPGQGNPDRAEAVATDPVEREGG